jgi:hypothetical protein
MALASYYHLVKLANMGFSSPCSRDNSIQDSSDDLQLPIPGQISMFVFDDMIYLLPLKPATWDILARCKIIACA